MSDSVWDGSVAAAWISPARRLRVQHEPFKAWVGHELNGYPAGVPLPAYRTGYHGTMKAQLAGPFGASATNVEVPATIFPREHPKRGQRLHLQSGCGGPGEPRRRLEERTSWMPAKMCASTLENQSPGSIRSRSLANLRRPRTLLNQP